MVVLMNFIIGIYILFKILFINPIFELKKKPNKYKHKHFGAVSSVGRALPF